MFDLSQFAAAALASSASFSMAFLLYRIWRRPLDFENGRMIKYGIGVMVLEFIIVHSGVFISVATSEGESIWKVIGVSLFYFLFVVAFSAAFGNRNLFISVMTLFIWRLIAFSFMMDRDEIEWHKHHSLVSMGLYFGAVILSLLPLPKLGIQGAWVGEVLAGSGSGHWIDHPHCAIGAATIYFTALGMVELFILSWYRG